MTRALVVHPGPSFSVADVHNGLVKGLRGLGVTTYDYNLDERLCFYSEAKIKRGARYKHAFTSEDATLLAAKGVEVGCYELWPDVVIIISAFFMPTEILDIIRSRGHKVVIVHTESPYEDDRQAERAEHADVNLINDPTNIDKFPRAQYLPHAYDPDTHHPGVVDPEYRSDFAFVGTGFPSRRNFFEQVDFGDLDVMLAGNWVGTPEDSPLRRYVGHELDECLPNERTADVYRGAATSANLYRVEADSPELVNGWAMGPREVELAACGTWFARNPRPEGDALFPMLPTFTEPDELGEMIRWALAHDDEREAAAAAARAAITPRTFESNAGALMRLCGL
ncbi:MAG TPA: hypothetical protein PLP26_06755 [Ilumatobacteraceae bacterium]|nr:hypothetical protein [Ilumatobacteraceae bacterium]